MTNFAGGRFFAFMRISRQNEGMPFGGQAFL
jgi:hypothetical protein